MVNSFSKKEYFKKVKKAFRTPYPALDFYKAIADRNYMDVEAINPDNKKVKYDDIDKELLLKYYDFLLFIDKEGFIYYLPAYIKVILNHCDEIHDTAIMDTFFQMIIKHKDNMTSEQKELLLQLLEYLKTKPSCIECIEDYIEETKRILKDI